MSAVDYRLAGVAGAVAEFCWSNVPCFDTFDLGEWFDPEIMSETDWAMAGCEPGAPTDIVFDAIETVFALLNRASGALWPDLVRRSRQLITFGHARAA